MAETQKISEECSHCHQAIGKNSNYSNSYGNYCCYGCMTVDELLKSENRFLDPEIYYLKKYDYLSHEAIQQKILDFEEGVVAKVQIHLPQIHCSSCIYLLENMKDIASGVLDVKVNFGQKKASITFLKSDITLAQIASLLEYIGYPPDFNTQDQKRSKSSKRLILQVGVAGFFFGNSMLLAFPEYLHTDLGLTPGLQTFFRYLMMVFSIPVITFSARDYFTSAFKNLRAGSLSIDLPIALGIVVIFIRSCFEIFQDLGPGYFDSLNGLIFFLLIGKWYQQKTYENFRFDRDFKSFIPLAAKLVLSNGKQKPIPIEDLQEGDIINVERNEILPADAVLKSESTTLDYSYITGEGEPIEKTKNEKVYAGAKIKSATALFEISSKAESSYLAQLWEGFGESQNGETLGFGFSQRVSQYFSPGIIILAIVAAAAWAVVDPSKSINVFTAVLIVACPCALALAEPFASGSMIRQFGKRGFFLKNTDILQKLSEIDFIAFDKTGTLTQMDSLFLKWYGEELNKEELEVLAHIAQRSSHSLAKPLFEYLNISDAENLKIDLYKEAEGEGIKLITNNKEFLLGRASFVQTTEKANTTSVYFKADGKLIGYFGFHQQTRVDSTEMIRELNADYELALLSGDNDRQREKFEKLFGTSSNLMFEQTPKEKLDYISSLNNEGKKTLMVGDGLNDAGALNKGHAGISICEDQLHYFPPSDAVLKASKIGSLPKFLELSKVNAKGIRIAIIISIIYNIIGLSFAVMGLLSPVVCAILMPVSSLTVVLFAAIWSSHFSRKLLD